MSEDISFCSYQYVVKDLRFKDKDKDLWSEDKDL